MAQALFVLAWSALIRYVRQPKMNRSYDRLLMQIPVDILHRSLYFEFK